VALDPTIETQIDDNLLLPSRETPHASRSFSNAGGSNLHATGRGKNVKSGMEVMRRTLRYRPDMMAASERKPAHTPALQLTPDHHLAGSINAVHLKYLFCDVETDCRNGLHW
jgi:hypothetical protein